MRFSKKPALATAVLVLLLVLSLGTKTVWAGGMQDLASFLQTWQAGSASFTQRVSNISQAAATNPKISRGSFAFMRPHRFRFDYLAPFAQRIVADGKTLWFYDVDLEQVTYKDQSLALRDTPMALIATAQDVQDLKKRFTLQELPGTNDGLAWIQAKPKDATDAAFVEANLGFDNGVLQKLVVLDPFGQHSALTFGIFSDSVDAAYFRFTPPEGVDVVSGF